MIVNKSLGYHFLTIKQVKNCRQFQSKLATKFASLLSQNLSHTPKNFCTDKKSSIINRLINKKNQKKIDPDVKVNIKNESKILASSTENVIKTEQKKTEEKDETFQTTEAKVTSKTRQKLDITQASTERNFITPIRVMNEYLLKPSDLINLRKFKRRSPYADEPSITVYLRKDVEAKALQVWSNFENLQKELKKRRAQQNSYKESLLNVKKILKEYQRLNDPSIKIREEYLKKSKKVVRWAVTINSTIFALKGIAWWFTKSDSMFAELVHSGVDTANQLVLYYGIKKSIQVPDSEHPYGFHSARFTTSLGAGVSIFFIGFGLNVYHGIHGIFHPMQIGSELLAYTVLGISLLFESITLAVAFSSLKKGAQEAGISLKNYIQSGIDPSSNVVFLEDTVAVLGVCLASMFMTMTLYSGNPIWDSMGSLCIGGLLGVAASFIISTNAKALYGRSIPMNQIESMNKFLENDVMIRATHDVKATDLGNNIFRYKAEVDIDGAQLTRYYLDTVDLEALLKEMQELKNIEEVEAFFLKHGENIVDLIGGEVDRIEKQLKKQYPQLRHVDLEIL